MQQRQQLAPINSLLSLWQPLHFLLPKSHKQIMKLMLLSHFCNDKIRGQEKLSNLPRDAHLEVAKSRFVLMCIGLQIPEFFSHIGETGLT